MFFHNNVMYKKTAMPAHDPRDLNRLFAERASAGDLDGLLELYEPGARLVGPNGGDADGEAAIRERLAGLLAMEPSVISRDVRVVNAGDLALLSGRRRMSFGRDDGERAGTEGMSVEVARRQADGSWRYVIDDPASIGLRPADPIDRPLHGASGAPV
jgi:ketosteroid isomerase-like protein